MAKRKPKTADKPEESQPKDRAERPRGGREGGGHFATITEPNGERHAVYIKGPRPADMKRGGMPESVRRHVMKRHGSAVRAKQGGFRERVEAAKAAKAKPPLPSLVRAKSRPPEVVAGRKEVAGRLRTAYREGRSYVTSSPDYHRNSPALQGGAALPTGRSYRRDVKEGIEKSKSNFMRTSAANPRVADSKQIEIREQAAGNAGTRKGLREIFRTGTVASKPAGPSLREQAAAARAKKGTPQERARRIIERIDVRANNVEAKASKYSQQSQSAAKRAYDASRSRSRTLREKLASQGKTREQHAAEIKQRGHAAHEKAVPLHIEAGRLRGRAERVALTQGLPNPNPTRDAYYSLARKMADTAPRGSFIRKVAATQRKKDLRYNRMMREYRRSS